MKMILRLESFLPLLLLVSCSTAEKDLTLTFKEQTCKELCTSCNGIGNFINDTCHCEVEENSLPDQECLNRVKSTAKNLGLEINPTKSESDSNSEESERSPRCSLRSAKPLIITPADAERVASYFMEGGPKTGSAHFHKKAPCDSSTDYPKKPKLPKSKLKSNRPKLPSKPKSSPKPKQPPPIEEKEIEVPPQPDAIEPQEFSDIAPRMEYPPWNSWNSPYSYQPFYQTQMYGYPYSLYPTTPMVSAVNPQTTDDPQLGSPLDPGDDGMVGAPLPPSLAFLQPVTSVLQSMIQPIPQTLIGMSNSLIGLGTHALTEGSKALGNSPVLQPSWTNKPLSNPPDQNKVDETKPDDTVSAAAPKELERKSRPTTPRAGNSRNLSPFIGSSRWASPYPEPHYEQPYYPSNLYPYQFESPLNDVSQFRSTPMNYSPYPYQPYYIHTPYMHYPQWYPKNIGEAALGSSYVGAPRNKKICKKSAKLQKSLKKAQSEEQDKDDDLEIHSREDD